MLLGIQSPWEVKRVHLQLDEKKVELELAHDNALPVRCPQCQRVCARHDHAPERQWRHLDVMQFTTIIRARTPRCQCPEHGIGTITRCRGRSRTDASPCSSKHSRWR